MYVYKCMCAAYAYSLTHAHVHRKNTSTLSTQCLCVFHGDVLLYIGTLMGITNMVGTIPGFVGPTVVAALTGKVRKLNET